MGKSLCLSEPPLPHCKFVNRFIRQELCSIMICTHSSTSRAHCVRILSVLTTLISFHPPDIASSIWCCFLSPQMPGTGSLEALRQPPLWWPPRLVGWADDDQADHGMNAVGQRAANAQNEIKWDKGLEGYGGEREERRWNRGRNALRRSCISS